MQFEGLILLNLRNFFRFPYIRQLLRCQINHQNAKYIHVYENRRFGFGDIVRSVLDGHRYLYIFFALIIFDCMVFLGNTSNFDEPFANTETDPGKISIAFYSGIFSYAGW